MKKRTKKIIIINLLIVFIIIAVISLVSRSVSREFDAYLQEVTIENPDLSEVPDGIYAGEVNTPIIQVSLNVHVKDHAITQIDLLRHRNGKGEEGEKVIDRILDKQRIDVDTVSGATYSSIVIQDAVQRALQGR